jgi:type I restriction enzyme M protein
MKDRVLRDFSEEDIAKLASVFHNWKRGTDYADQAGFCCSAKLADIEQADFVLTPGRYVGAAEEEEDSEPFAEKFTRLKAELDAQFEESSDLEAKIKANLEGLGL